MLPGRIEAPLNGQSCFRKKKTFFFVMPPRIDPIHVTAMMNKKRGLEGKCARQYVNRDVTSLLLPVPVM